MRLIDADKLKKAVEGLPDCYNGFSDTFDKACIIGVIDEQQTIEKLDVATEYCMKRCLVMITMDTYETLIAYYNRANTVPKRGNWIADKYTRICSECGRSYWLRFAEPWNYCPHCGVCMKRKGGQNGRKED